MKVWQVHILAQVDDMQVLGDDMLVLEVGRLAFESDDKKVLELDNLKDGMV